MNEKIIEVKSAQEAFNLGYQSALDSLEKNLSEELEKLLDENFIKPNIDSNGDLFLQNKYDDGDGNSMKTLVSVVRQLVSREREGLGKMRHTIYKVRNGEWRLEWEDGSYSIHSSQYGAEKMAFLIESKQSKETE